MASSVLQIVQYWVDLALDDNLEQEHSYFEAEGAVEQLDGHADVDEDTHDHDVRLKLIGKELREYGDEFNKQYLRENKKSLSEEVKDFLANHQKSGNDLDTAWPIFADLVDSAIRDTHLEDSVQILAAVLMSVRGLGYLGDSVRILVQRYIIEKNLDETMKKLEAMDKHPDLS